MELREPVENPPLFHDRSATARCSERQGVAKEARRPGETVDEKTQRTRQNLGRTKQTFRSEKYFDTWTETRNGTRDEYRQKLI